MGLAFRALWLRASRRPTNNVVCATAIALKRPHPAQHNVVPQLALCFIPSHVRLRWLLAEPQIAQRYC